MISRLLAQWSEDSDLVLKHDVGLREVSGLEWFRDLASQEVANHPQSKALAERVMEADAFSG